MTTQLIYAFLLSAAIVAVALWRRYLNRSGALGALLVGTLTFGLGGWPWGVLLGIFFISSSVLSKYKASEKLAAAEKFDKGHERDFSQTMANGGVGSVIAALSVLVPWGGWWPLFIGVMATVNADTWATELGTLSRQPPRLITTGRRVEVGTSGGVSPLGTLVSLVGGAVIGAAGGLFAPDLSWWLTGFIGGAGGLAGSLFDSLLGATVQQIYWCDHCQKDTERKVHKCGHETRPLRGWSWLNNDLVNLFASLIGGAVALALWVFAA